jgi:hypothetical protein
VSCCTAPSGCFEESESYIDFFEFLPPGGFAITAAWFTIAGLSMLSARILAILVIAGITCLIYLTCRHTAEHAQSSAFIALAWVILVPGDWIQVNHHYFTTLLSMLAAWAAIASVKRRRPSLAGPLVAGVAAGAATTVTPTRGILATLAAAAPFAHLRRSWTDLVVYLLGTALVPALMLSYLTLNGTLSAAFDDCILFTASQYISIQPMSFGASASLL